MLDDNLRVLGRRVNDLEIDLTEKKDRIRVMRAQNEELQVKLDSIYEEQTAARENIDKQTRQTLEMKDSEIRRLYSERQGLEHQLQSEVDTIRDQNKQELEMIQDKVQTAMAKKKEVIESLAEELRLKDLQVLKLKEMMER